MNNYNYSLYSQLTKELNDLYASSSSSSISYYSDFVETHLIQFVKSYLISKSGYSQTSGYNLTDYIIINKNKYQIFIAPELANQSILNIAIFPAGLNVSHEENIKEPSISISLQEYIGKYKKINLFLPKKISFELESVANDIKTIMSTGYGWLLTKYRKAINEQAKKCEEELLASLRHLFYSVQKEKMLNDIWLIIISENKAFYAIDTHEAEKNLENAQKNSNLKSNQSVAKSVGEFIENSIPFDLTFSEDAIRNRSRIDVDISQAKYSSVNTNFGLSEEFIYNNILMSFQPIVVSGNNLLLAVYPSEISDNVEELIKNHSLKMEEIIINNAVCLQNNSKSSQNSIKKYLDLSKMGEFMGGFVKGYLGNG